MWGIMYSRFPIERSRLLPISQKIHRNDQKCVNNQMIVASY